MRDIEYANIFKLSPCLPCMSLHVYLLFLQFIPTTLVANGPLVWEAEQQINSVSFDSPLSMTIK